LTGQAVGQHTNALRSRHPGVLRTRRVALKDGRVALIRRAGARDAGAVMSLVNNVATEGVYLMTERVRRTPKEFRRRLRKAKGSSAMFLVALVDGEVVGSADVARGEWSKNDHTASFGIAIRKDARGVGLGTAVTRATVAWVKAVGVRKLTLGVFATNSRALALYRRAGFVEEGRLKGQVVLRGKPVDEVLMALWL
jgi:RimJ/RimL family protein N-acetyltransferase